jgi:hypothetical protein
MLQLTVQVTENTRATWELALADVESLRADGTGTLVKTTDGKTQLVLEAISDIGIQCQVLGVPLPTVEA